MVTYEDLPVVFTSNGITEDTEDTEIDLSDIG